MGAKTKSTHALGKFLHDFYSFSTIPNRDSTTVLAKMQVRKTEPLLFGKGSVKEEEKII
jgi:hypothetical protein